jgi:hypothetical protein
MIKSVESVFENNLIADSMSEIMQMFADVCTVHYCGLTGC